MWEETPEEEYLRLECSKPKDLKKMFDAIRERWPNLKYPQGKRKESGAHSDETGRLHKMFETVLETLSGGKCDEFLLDFLEGRYRSGLKSSVTQALCSDVLNPLHDLIDSCKVSKDTGRSCSDPVVNAVRLNAV